MSDYRNNFDYFAPFINDLPEGEKNQNTTRCVFQGQTEIKLNKKPRKRGNQVEFMSDMYTIDEDNTVRFYLKGNLVKQFTNDQWNNF